MFEFVEAAYPHPLRSFGEQVLNDSFPTEERPALTDLRARKNPAFHFDIVQDNGIPIGILTHWDFPTFTYIEHFAILEELRNKRLGGCVLDQFTRGNRLVVLEAELPENEIARRRLNFYQRHGLIIAPYPYIQPAYAEGLPSVPLHILSTQKISLILFEEIKQTLYANVYNR